MTNGGVTTPFPNLISSMRRVCPARRVICTYGCRRTAEDESRSGLGGCLGLRRAKDRLLPERSLALATAAAPASGNLHLRVP